MEKGEIFVLKIVFKKKKKLNPFLMEVNMSPNVSPSAHQHLSTMFENILSDLGKITGISLGKKRFHTVIDGEFEKKNAGNWVLIEMNEEGKA